MRTQEVPPRVRVIRATVTIVAVLVAVALVLWWWEEQRINPTKPMSSWRTAWRSILKAAGLKGVRFHDGRHTAITTLAEKGLPDWVIQAQVGHVDPQMMKTYSHIRRKALNEAAAALEPNPTHQAENEY